MKNKRYTKQIISDYVVIDIESTGLQFQFDEIIEIGIARVRNNIVVETYSQLIKPIQKINGFITSFTGITNDMVKNMPSILDVKDSVLEFIGDDIILGHNTAFDLAFLNFRFNTKISNQYMDTLQFARKVFTNLKNHKLTTLVKNFNLSKNEHRALADCISTKQLYDLIKKTMAEKNLKIETLWSTGKVKNIVSNNTVFDEDGPFYERHMVFSGTLEKMTKSEAEQLVVDVGAILDNSVTKKTNILILGSTEQNSILKGKKSAKQIKAEKYIQEGQDLEIIDQFTFYNIMDV